MRVFLLNEFRRVQSYPCSDRCSCFLCVWRGAVLVKPGYCLLYQETIVWFLRVGHVPLITLQLFTRNPHKSSALHTRARGGVLPQPPTLQTYNGFWSRAALSAHTRHSNCCLGCKEIECAPLLPTFFWSFVDAASLNENNFLPTSCKLSNCIFQFTLPPDIVNFAYLTDTHDNIVVTSFPDHPTTVIKISYSLLVSTLRGFVSFIDFIPSLLNTPILKLSWFSLSSRATFQAFDHNQLRVQSVM